jgi:hypothetical protein
LLVYENINENSSQELEEYLKENENENEYEYENFIWNFDENNYKIPYHNNKKIKLLKITNNEYIYDLISSNSLLPDKEIICGENIQYNCDVVIGNNDSINWNPNNRLFSKEIKHINHVDNINNYKNIFVFTHNLIEFYEKYNNQLTNKNIISHNSDYEITNEYTKYFNNINYQISQNVLISHPKLLTLPIGIENRQWFNHDLLHNIRKRTDIKKEKHIYFFCSLGTHPSRNECYNILKNKIPTAERKSKEEYFIELKKYKYAICPRGNGIDTHRLWECLYLDVIPIMISRDFVNINNLPIIILNSWNDFNESVLKNSFENLKTSKITMSYYKTILQT